MPGFFRHMGADGGNNKRCHNQEFYRYPAVNCYPEKDQLDDGADADHLPEKLPVPDAFSDQQQSAAYQNKDQEKSGQGYGVLEKKG